MPDDPKAARAYIALFRKHTVPGTDWVDTNTRRIMLDDMSDADDPKRFTSAQGCSC